MLTAHVIELGLRERLHSKWWWLTPRTLSHSEMSWNCTVQQDQSANIKTRKPMNYQPTVLFWYINTIFSRYRVSIIKIGLSWNCIIFIMRITKLIGSILKLKQPLSKLLKVSVNLAQNSNISQCYRVRIIYIWALTMTVYIWHNLIAYLQREYFETIASHENGTYLRNEVVLVPFFLQNDHVIFIHLYHRYATLCPIISVPNNLFNLKSLDLVCGK